MSRTLLVENFDSFGDEIR